VGKTLSIKRVEAIKIEKGFIVNPMKCILSMEGFEENNRNALFRMKLQGNHKIQKDY